MTCCVFCVIAVGIVQVRSFGRNMGVNVWWKQFEYVSMYWVHTLCGIHVHLSVDSGVISI